MGALEAVVLLEGDEETARSLYEQSLQALNSSRSRGRVGLILIDMGDIWLRQDKGEQQATILYKQGLRMWQDSQDAEPWIGIVKALCGIADVAAAQGQAERAGRLLAVVDRLLPTDDKNREMINRRISAAREKLDATRFKAGWAEGRLMTEEQGIAEALQHP